MANKAEGVLCSILHKRLITQLEGKMAPALRVAAKKAPLGVASHLFGMTKLHSSRLEWQFFSHNSGDSINVNRPHLLLGFNLTVASQSQCIDYYHQ